MSLSFLRSVRPGSTLELPSESRSFGVSLEASPLRSIGNVRAFVTLRENHATDPFTPVSHGSRRTKVSESSMQPQAAGSPR